MKTVHLLNAAVMPTAGIYDLEQISLDEFSADVIEAYTNGTLRHYIGYQNTLDAIHDWIGMDLGAINVEQTKMADGEAFLVLRLRRRVSPAAKVRTRRDHTQLAVEDFDFYRGTYFQSPRFISEDEFINQFNLMFG